MKKRNLNYLTNYILFFTLYTLCILTLFMYSQNIIEHKNNILIISTILIIGTITLMSNIFNVYQIIYVYPKRMNKKEKKENINFEKKINNNKEIVHAKT